MMSGSDPNRGRSYTCHAALKRSIPPNQASCRRECPSRPLRRFEAGSLSWAPKTCRYVLHGRLFHGRIPTSSSGSSVFCWRRKLNFVISFSYLNLPWHSVGETYKRYLYSGITLSDPLVMYGYVKFVDRKVRSPS